VSSSSVDVASRRDLLQDAAAALQNAAAERVSHHHADALDVAGDVERSLCAYRRSAASSIPTFRYAPCPGFTAPGGPGVPEWIQRGEAVAGGLCVNCTPGFSHLSTTENVKQGPRGPITGTVLAPSGTTTNVSPM
jgi:hypothetical protein